MWTSDWIEERYLKEAGYLLNFKNLEDPVVIVYAKLLKDWLRQTAKLSIKAMFWFWDCIPPRERQRAYEADTRLPELDFSKHQLETTSS